MKPLEDSEILYAVVPTRAIRRYLGGKLNDPLKEKFLTQVGNSFLGTRFQISYFLELPITRLS